MSTLLNPIPVAIILAGILLSIAILTGRTANAWKLIKGAILYGVLISLAIIWSANTVLGADLAYSSWNVLAVAVFQLAFMLLVSGGVQAGVVGARPDPPTPEELEKIKEGMEDA